MRAPPRALQQQQGPGPTPVLSFLFHSDTPPPSVFPAETSTLKLGALLVYGFGSDASKALCLERGIKPLRFFRDRLNGGGRYPNTEELPSASGSGRAGLPL